jgi:hypothetical protein
MGTEWSLVLLQKYGYKQDNYQELRTIFSSGNRRSSDLCDLPDDQVHMDYCTMGVINGHISGKHRGFIRK